MTRIWARSADTRRTVAVDSNDRQKEQIRCLQRLPTAFHGTGHQHKDFSVLPGLVSPPTRLGWPSGSAARSAASGDTRWFYMSSPNDCPFVVWIADSKRRGGPSTRTRLLPALNRRYNEVPSDRCIPTPGESAGHREAARGNAPTILRRDRRQTSA